MPIKTQHNVSLKPITTFGIDVKAKELIEFESVNQLTEIEFINYPNKLILGGGSNLLFKQNFNGTIFQNKIKGIEVVTKSEVSITLKVGAGESWHEFVLHCVSNNYCGIENLSLIPGTVGAAPIQNIGAYGVEVKDVISEVEVYDTINRQTITFTNEECNFGYRDSVFKSVYKNRYIITYVYFTLSMTPKIASNYGAISTILEEQKIEKPSIQDISNAVIAIRQSKLPDPKELGNAGSFFKNPVVTIESFLAIKEKYPSVPSYPINEISVKIPAGWLIEILGWKGKNIGNCGVHHLQALVLVNYGEATGKEIFNLSEKIIQDVFSNFNIVLEREVNIIE